MKKGTTILLLLLFSLNTFAQKSNLGAWYNYFGSQKLNASNWNLHNEIQYRNYNAGGDLEQLLIRVGIGYNLSPNNNNLLLGYGFIHGKTYTGIDKDIETFKNEHRIFEQFITKQQFSRIGLQHRYRFEQRFFTDDFKLRFRYLIGVTIPFNKPTMDAGAIYLSAYDEVFLNTENTIFDRNRMFVAAGYVISKNLRFDIGFMRQALNSNSRNQVMISLYNNAPFLFSKD